MDEWMFLSSWAKGDAKKDQGYYYYHYYLLYDVTKKKKESIKRA